MLIIAPIITTNVEKLAQDKKWDLVLTDWWPKATTFFSWADNTLMYVTAAFLGGVSSALWLVRLLPETPSNITEPKVASPSMVDFEPPRYSLYDARDSFSLLEAAFLWGDVTPNSNPAVLNMFPEAMASYKLLSESIRSGKLPCYKVDRHGKLSNTTTAPEPTWVVTKDDLTQYANGIGSKPKFLFQDARSWMA